ncbi:MAG: LysM peptidoglycan-binding domain-containing protein [Bacteroidia bacterium]
MMFSQVTEQSELAGDMPVYLGNVNFTKVNYYRVGKNYINPTADNGITLNPSQVARLQAIVNSPTAYVQEHMTGCFRPESQFVFFDAEKVMQGQLVLSFDCDALLAQPDIPMMLVTPNAGLSTKGENDLKKLVAEITQSGVNVVSAASASKMMPEEVAQTETPAKEMGATRGLSSTPKTTTSQGGTHVVKKGDTLYSICRANGLKISDVQAANNMSNYNLRIGQELVLPVKE